MRNRRKGFSTTLAASLVLGALALVVLVDVSQWPLRMRPGVKSFRRTQATQTQTPAPTGQTSLPIPQAPTPTPTAAAPGYPACTPAQIPTQPSGAQAPVSSSPDYGGEPVGVGRGYLEGSNPTYAPDGRKIAFVNVVDSHIWIIGVDGQNLRQLTRDRDPNPVGQTGESEPAWSPDGSAIAFASSGHIWLVAPDGSNLRQLTTDPGNDTTPVWSPDGSQIAFVSNRSGSTDIWIMNAKGTNSQKVTPAGVVGTFSYPAFSPNSRQLVFSSPQSVYESNLMIINIEGTGLCQVTAGPSHDEHPRWSARGIVFSRYEPPRPNRTGGRTLWLVQSDGSGLQALQGAAGDNPAWSPDGTRIAFDDGANIYVFKLLEQTVKPLTQLNAQSLIIYIKPGAANTINPKTESRVQVAILSTPWLDPIRQIDQTSITFGPSGDERSFISCTEDEVNGDGLPDLVCDFNIGAAFSSTHEEGILRAKGISGILFEGRDAVRVLNP